MSIPTEAVEAAAKVHFERGEGYWEDMVPEARSEALDDMRAALEAAASSIRAEALEDAAAEFENQPPKLRANYVIALRTYAAQPWRLRARSVTIPEEHEDKQR